MSMALSRVALIHVTVGLALVSLGSWPSLTAATLGVQVLRRSVPAEPADEPTEYLSGALHGLGLRDQAIRPPLDPVVVNRALGSPNDSAPWLLLASYAILAERPDLSAADEWLARVAPSERDPRAAFWRGRAAWARGDKSRALAEWYLAFGTDYVARERLAEAMFIVKEQPLAIDATMSLFDLPDSDAARRSAAFKRLRDWNWLTDGTASLEWADRILAHRAGSTYQALSDPLAADIVAWRAHALLSRGMEPEGLTALSLAESLSNTGYVQSVRAWLQFRSGMRARAIQTTTESIAAAGADGHALLLAGHVLWELGEMEPALRAWRLVVDRDALLAHGAQARIAIALQQR